MAQVIITKNGTGSATPTSLVQGELGLNVSTGQLFYGTSGSSNSVSSSFVLTNVTASNISASGTITANFIQSDQLFSHVGDANTGIQLGSDTVQIEGNDVILANFTTARIELNQPVTASVEISSSETMYANIFSASQGLSVGNHAAEPAIQLYNASNFVMANIGNIYKNSTNTGFALFSDYNTNTKLFEISNSILLV